MGIIMNICEAGYEYDKDWKRVVYKNGLSLTKNGWKTFELTKRRRKSKWRKYNKCHICGKSCYQSFGDKYEQICLSCSTEWLKNSIKEMDKVKAKLEEQQKFIAKNKDRIIKIETNKLDEWEKEKLLDKLEGENE